TGGSLAPGESDDITLTFDANYGVGTFNLDDLLYEGTIAVLSNDPATPEVVVPVTFTITGESGGESDVLAYWNFNDPAAEGNPWPQPIASNLGSGTFTYNLDEAGIIDFGGTTLNALNEDVAGTSFSVQGGPEIVNNGRYFEVNLSTLGYEDIVFSYATRGTNSGFDSQLAEFSTDG